MRLRKKVFEIVNFHFSYRDNVYFMFYAF